MHTSNCGHALECNKWKTGCGKCPRFKQETKSWFFDKTHRSWLKMKKAFEGFNNLIVTSVSPWLMERAKESPILADKRHFVVLTFVTASKIDIIGGADWPTLFFLFYAKNNGLYFNLCCLGVVGIIVGLILKKNKK